MIRGPLLAFHSSKAIAWNCGQFCCRSKTVVNWKSFKWSKKMNEPFFGHLASDVLKAVEGKCTFPEPVKQGKNDRLLGQIDQTVPLIERKWADFQTQKLVDKDTLLEKKSTSYLSKTGQTRMSTESESTSLVSKTCNGQHLCVSHWHWALKKIR